jgi:molecular chaperone GrpE
VWGGGGVPPPPPPPGGASREHPDTERARQAYTAADPEAGPGAGSAATSDAGSAGGPSAGDLPGGPGAPGASGGAASSGAPAASDGSVNRDMAAPGTGSGTGSGTSTGSGAGSGEAADAGAGTADTGTADTGDDLAAVRASAQERLADLQRLQAEYVNYRRRVERDRDVARDVAVAGVLEALLPVLDDVHLARQHGDLESGPFAAIAEKLETTLARYGLVRYGEPGETFDPTVHEALMHTEVELAEGTTEPTVVQVLQPGYRAGERVLRPARVAVADPH